MPMFRSRCHIRSRPLTPAKACTTSCDKKLCACNQLSTTLMTKPSTKPCKEMESKRESRGKPKECVKSPKADCKYKKDCKDSKQSEKEREKTVPCKFFCCNKKNCEQPEPCTFSASCGKSGKCEQPEPYKTIMVKPRLKTKEDCVRPGCNTKKPCIDCCKIGCKTLKSLRSVQSARKSTALES